MGRSAYWDEQIAIAKKHGFSPLELSMAANMHWRKYPRANFDLSRPECMERLRDAKAADEAYSMASAGDWSWEVAR